MTLTANEEGGWMEEQQACDHRFLFFTICITGLGFWFPLSLSFRHSERVSDDTYLSFPVYHISCCHLIASSILA